LNLKHLVEGQVDDVELKVRDVRIDDLRELLCPFQNEPIEVEFFSLNAEMLCEFLEERGVSPEFSREGGEIKKEMCAMVQVAVVLEKVR
jgi:hypothetical protein